MRLTPPPVRLPSSPAAAAQVRPGAMRAIRIVLGLIVAAREQAHELWLQPDLGTAGRFPVLGLGS